MKPRHRFLRFPIAALGFSGLISPILSGAAPTPRYWNVGGSGGDGNWSTSPGDKNWNLVAGSETGNTTWPDSFSERAFFQDAIGGTVTVVGPVKTTGIVQSGADYTVNAGTVTLTRFLLDQPTMEVRSGTLTIDSVLDGFYGMGKTGTGNLVISGANTYAGPTSVNAGTLTLTGSLAGGTIVVATGGTLVDQSGGLAASAAVTNSGTFVVNAAETVTQYTQRIGGLLTGPAALTVTGMATLSGGTVASSLQGSITSNENVLVTGPISGASLAVTGGILTLKGPSSHSAVSIGYHATLVDSLGTLNPAAKVTNSGTLTVDSNQTLFTYAQSPEGTLNGSAALTVTGGAALAGGKISGKLFGDITTTGSTRIDGEVGGGFLTVEKGPVTLTGISTNSIVTISKSGELSDFSGGLLDSAQVTNSGVFNVNADDTVATYVQNSTASMRGSKTLTVTGGILLNGGQVSGKLAGDTTVTGTLVMSGEIGGGSLAIKGGMFWLWGTSTNTSVEISEGAALTDLRYGLDAGATVINRGTLVVQNVDDMISDYIQHATGTLDGVTTLTVTGGATLLGGVVSGNLVGNIVSSGDLRVSGSLAGESLELTRGTLTLTGTASSRNVLISRAATLLNSNGGLAADAAVINAGSLDLNSPDTVASYRSTGGSLKGNGLLTATVATLEDGSTVSGGLTAGNLTTHGSVSISGRVEGDRIRIEDGILTNTGTFGDTATRLNLAAGATLIAKGTQQFGVLTTSGTGAGTWLGNLRNSSVVAPGGSGSFGILQVSRDFSQASSATLKMDVSANQSDILAVGGRASFGGTLSLRQVGAEQIAPFIPLTLVSAATYGGNITTIRENLDGAVFFNPEKGSITRISLGSGTGDLFSVTNRNQRSTLISLYDDVIEPGKTNITRDPSSSSGYKITSGVADATNPDLLNALAASFTSTGLDVALLNQLSAEIYTAVTDYAIQATRQHQRTALSAPALNPRPPTRETSSKEAILPAPAFGQNWEFFAAADYFNAETDTSRNRANYEISGAGLVFGARNQLTDRFQLAGYGAADDGSIDGRWIDSDQSGWSFGLIGETLVHPKSQTRLTTAVSYGHFDSDGTRQSAAATPAGWTSGKVDFDNVDSRSFELYAGLETTIYQNERFRVVPTVGLRFAAAAMDRFTESTGAAAGSPIALKVREESYQQWTAELGISAEATLTEQLSLHGQLGFNAGLGDDSHDLESRFAKGNRTMTATSEGLTDDLIYLGLGVEYRLTPDLRIGVGYRADLRPGHPAENACNVSTAFRF